MLQYFASLALDSTLNQWIADSYWLWPILEILHFMGLCLLLGGLLIVDLRLAGHFRGFTPTASHRLIPLVVTGFAINLITGILFFIGDPERYAINIGFQIKMWLILAAGLNTVFYYRMLHHLTPAWRADTPAPVLAKFFAYTSLSLWTGVLLFGRLIPYIGTG